MLGQRVLTAVIGLPPLVALIIWGPGWAIWLLFMAAGPLAFFEYARIVARFDPRIAWTSLIAGEALLGLLALSAFMAAWGAAVAGLGALAVLALVFYSSRQKILEEAALAFLSLGLVFLPLGFMAAIALSPGPGRWWLLFLMATLFAADTTAYFIGRAWGRKKMSPHLSPAKTWAGFYGGLLGGGLAGGAFIGLAVGLVSDQPFDPALGVLVGIALATLGVVGDLTVSLLKRTFGVKDASTILPGHGGFLDRLDSFILAGPAFYFILLLWGR